MTLELWKLNKYCPSDIRMETWEKAKCLECFSSGDVVHFHKGHLFSRCNNGVTCTKLPQQDGPNIAEVVGKVEVEEDPVLAFCVDQNANEDLKNVLFTSHKSGMVRTWSGFNLESSEVLRCDHRGPISLLLAGGSLLVTGSADLSLKLWNIETRHCEGLLRSCSGVPLMLIWATTSDDAKKYVVSGQVDGNISVWDVEVMQSPVAVLDKHRSQISAITAVKNKNLLISCGRDQLIAFWSLNGFTCLKMVPSFEEIETILPVDFNTASYFIGKKIAKDLLASDGEYCISAGEKGKLRIWSVDKFNEINFEKGKLDKSLVAPGRKIESIWAEDKTFYIIQDDTISQYSLKKASLMSVTCSNQYEVLEFAILEPSYLIVASGSSDVKVYNLEDHSLTVGVGHTDAVLSVSACRDGTSSFLSCGKDQTVFLWNLEAADDGVKLKMVARGLGHSSYIGAVGLSKSLIYSASKDGVVKLWKRPQEPTDGAAVQELTTIRTVLAHNQDINSLDISGDYLATASQDKTCKVWNGNDLSLLTTLTGHRRGIWCCRFVVRMLATASADCTIKLWETNHFTCQHTLEGHLASVMSVCVLQDSKRMASVSSDGLLKLWNSESSESIGSFDAHDDKIWTVESWKDKIITGGRDGQIIFWRNITEQVRTEERKKTEELVKTDQRLQNYLVNGNLQKALRLCIRLDRPRQARKTLELLQKRDQLEDALAKLNLDDRNALFKMIVQWNAIGTFSALAQHVLRHLLKEALINERPLSAEKCAGIISYSEKHYQRLDRLASKVAVVDLLLQKM